MRAFAITTLTVAAIVGWVGGGGRLPFVGKAAPPPAQAQAAVEDWQTPHASGGTVVISRGWGGHFFTDADVAGKSLQFVVDTGATSVALSREDAQRVGIDVDHLTFDHQAQTAAGVTHIAQTTLPRLRIGEIQVLNVPAIVLDVPSNVSLLGQSFLSRIDKVSIEGDKMTLTKL